jgi:acyl-coenzyme A synthetase/AMP-(fatty) acid ligase
MGNWAAALNTAPQLADVWPLVAHGPGGLDRTFAWRGGRSISVAGFLCDVAAVAARLPPTTHVLNACSDRYLFAVSLAAGMQRGIVTLLPPARTSGVIAHLRAEAPDLALLVDHAEDAEASGGLPVHRIELGMHAAPTTPLSIPQFPGTQLVARMYSSGSTGQPQPQPKLWGSLVRNAAAQVQRLAEAAPDGIALLGTVPAQHCYGFESTVLVALAAGATLTASRPFFPADIAAELEQLPRPRGLVTTPYHLRTVLDAGLALPPIDLLLCATAPLTPALANAAEQAFRAPLLEIYGATECGQLAMRRTTREQHWTLYAGVSVTLHDGRAWANGGHVLTPTPLADLIEPAGAGGFVLLGREADMVNIAGKRSSLAYLTQVLLHVPGVVDGAFFIPEEEEAADGANITRLAAAVVAPGQSSNALMAALRENLDPVFLPRPLLLVPALPRSATSKLPVTELRALLRSARPSA